MPYEFQESPETSDQPRKLFDLLADVQKLAGGEHAMLQDEDWQPDDVVSGQEVHQQTMSLTKEKLMQQQYMKFEDLVRRNVGHHFQEMQQMAMDRPADLGSLEQISLNMVLWKYEEMHLKAYLESVQRYKNYVEKYPDIASAYRDTEEVRRWEQNVEVNLGKLQTVVPSLQAVSRLIWAEELLAAEKAGDLRLTPEDRTQLQELVTFLRSKLPASGNEQMPGIALHAGATLDELRAARGQLAGAMRSVFIETTSMEVQRSKAVPTQTPNALYLKMLSFHRRKLFEELRDDPQPDPEKFATFLDVNREINQLSLQYHVDQLKFQADMQSLLALRERFGPEALGRLASNPEKARQIADFYSAVQLPEKISEQLKGQELAHMQEGLSRYMEVVAEDVSQYGSWFHVLNGMLLAQRKNEEKLISFRHGTSEVAWWLPEHTLGYARFVGLDYADIVGQGDELKNHRAVLEFQAMQNDTESMKDILGETQPELLRIRNLIETDMAVLTTLQKEHPPEECVPGRLHNGVPYETIKQRYIDAIAQLREHHDEWIAVVETLYDDLTDNLGYHTNLMAQHRLLDDKNAPSLWIGLAMTYALTELGQYGGVRSIPYAGLPLRGSKLVERVPFFGRTMGFVLSRAEGGVNVLTQPFVEGYDLLARFTSMPRVPRVETPAKVAARKTREAAALRRELATLQEAVRAAGNAGKTEDVNAILQRLAALQQQSENGIPTQQLADALRELDDIKATLARSVPEEQFKAMQELFVRAEQRVSTMQQTVTEIFNNRYAGLVRQAEEIQSMKGAARLQAWEQFFEAEVRPFMREFNAFSEHAPDARRLLAEQVFGSPLNERQWQALQLAHAETDPMKKFRILAESIDNFDNLPKEQQLVAIQRIKRLMQTGLAGEAPAVADETARVGIRTLDLGAEYTDDVLTRFPGVFRRCSELVESSDDALKLAKDPLVFSVLAKGGDGADAMRFAAETDEGIDGIRRAASYVFTLSESGKRVPAILFESPVIRIIAEGSMPPAPVARTLLNTIDDGGRILLKTGEPATAADLARSMRMVESWQSASAGIKVLYGLGVAAEIAGVVIDIVSLREAQQRISDVLTKLDGELTQAGFVKRGNSYVHSSGARIDVKQFEEQLGEQENVAWARLGVDGAGLATSVLAPSLMMGPAGLVVAGVILTAHGLMNMKEEADKRELIMNTPIGVLSVLGLQRLTGTDEKTWVDDMSVWRSADLVSSASEKPEIRKRMLIVMFARELARVARENPAAYAEMTGGKDILTFIGENEDFYKTDFDHIIAPFLAIDFFSQADTRYGNWDNIRDLCTADTLLVFFTNSVVDRSAVQASLRRAAEFYLDYKREKNYRTAMDRHDRQLLELGTHIPQHGTPRSMTHLLQMANHQAIDADWEERISILGAQKVDNKPLSEYRTPQGAQTIAERRILEAYAFLDQYHRYDDRGDVHMEQIYHRFFERSVEEPSKVPQERYNEYLREASSLYRHINERGFYNHGLKRYIIDYGRLIAQYPEFDPNGELLAHIRAIPDGWYGVYSEDEVPPYYRKTLALLRSHLNDVLDKRTEIFGSSSDMPAEDQMAVFYNGDRAPIRLYQTRWLESGGSHFEENSRVHTLRVVIDGKEEVFTATEGEESRWVTPYGMLYCHSQRVRGSYIYSWSFQGNSEGKMRYYYKNKNEHEEYGGWLRTEQLPEQRNETLPPGQDWYDIFDSHATFTVEVTLWNDEKVIAEHCGNRQTPENLAPIAEYIDVSPIMVADTSGRIRWIDRETRQHYWDYRGQRVGWSIRLKKGGVKSVRILPENGDVPDRVPIVPDFSSIQRLPKMRGGFATMPTVEVGEKKNLALFNESGGIIYPHSEGTISLELLSGEVVEGSVSSPGVLYRYLSFYSLGPDRFPEVQEHEMPAIPDEAQGWKIGFRNRHMLRKMTITYPNGGVAEMSVESPPQRMIRMMKLKRVDGREYFRRDDVEGEFYLRPDGTALWTGADDGSPHLLEVKNGKLEKHLWMDLESGTEFTLFNGRRLCVVDYEDGSRARFMLEPDKPIPTVKGVQISASNDGGWNIVPDRTIDGMHITDVDTGQQSYVSVDHGGYPHRLNIE